MDTDPVFDGVLLAPGELHEIETIQPGESVEEHFLREPPRVFARFLDRISAAPRGSVMRTVLVIDLRASGIAPADALTQLRSALTKEGTPYAPDSRSMWAAVRFITRDGARIVVGDEVSLQ